MLANEIENIYSLSAPTTHSRSDYAVVSAWHPDLGSNRNVGQLWKIFLAGDKSPVRLTQGINDAKPVFSPDGNWIAYLKTQAEGQAQLAILSSSGGESYTLTNQKLGVLDFCWHPDSNELAFISAVPEPGRYGSVSEINSATEPARRITTEKYRMNGAGYTIDKPSQLFTVRVPQSLPEPEYVLQPYPNGEKPTAPDSSVQQRSWESYAVFSPQYALDGKSVYLLSRCLAKTDTDLTSQLIKIVLDDKSKSAETAASPELVIDSKLGISAFLAKDSDLYLLGIDQGESGRDFIGRSNGLFKYSADQKLTRLTTPDELNAESGTPIVATNDGSLLVIDQVRGRTLLKAFTGTELVDVLPGDYAVSGVAVSSEQLVITASSYEDHGEVYLLNSKTNQNSDTVAPTKLTNFHAKLAASGVVIPQEFTATGRDGYPIHGWVLTPKTGTKHPVLLNIHGGPFAQYGIQLFDEAQVYVAAGYAVVMCNPRGSAGYGEEHGRAIRQQMGTLDANDVLDFLDASLAEFSSLDAGRVGVMGGSYGGYLSAWLTTQTDRFVAAIVERGFLDPELFFGTSDIGSYFGEEYVGVTSEQIAAQSPQANVQNVKTPSLIIHSELDLRCPISQAERYYLSLKRNGVATEFLVFPGETHELTRSGKPRHRVERFAAILDWWQRYLPIS